VLSGRFKPLAAVNTVWTVASALVIGVNIALIFRTYVNVAPRRAVAH
jgi:hypothetical protein